MRQLLRYYRPFRRQLALAVLSNLLMSVFMVISIPVLQPFLQILFNPDEMTAKAAEPQGGFDDLESRSSAFLPT